MALTTLNPLTSSRRTQTTRAGMPSQGGRRPFSPTPRPPAPVEERAQRGAGILGAPRSALTPSSWTLQKTGLIGEAAAYQDWARQQQQAEREQLQKAYGDVIARQVQRQTGAQAEEMERGLRRRGAEYAGYLPAAEQAIRAAGITKAAETMGEFQAQLLSLEQQEMAGYRKGTFDYLRALQMMFEDRTTQYRVQDIQRTFAADQAKKDRWANALNSFGHSAGQVAGGL